MARKRSGHPAEDDLENEAPAAQEGNPASSSTNRILDGAGRPAAEDTSSPGASSPTMQRAEELADRLGAKIGYFASMIGHQVMRLAARAREEAEDMWAEAQEIRQRRQQPTEPPQQP